MQYKFILKISATEILVEEERVNDFVKKIKLFISDEAVFFKIFLVLLGVLIFVRKNSESTEN